MTQFDIQYRNLLERVLSEGQEHVTRAVNKKTGLPVRAKKVFHHSFEFDLQEEFPILTTKQMPKSKSIPENGFLFVSEIIWIMVMGSNKISDLQALGNNVWNEWTKEDGTIGPAYGAIARKTRKHHFDEDNMYTHSSQIDQVQRLIEGIKNDPYGRRHMINLWSVPDLDDMGLPPCAFLTLWDVTSDGYLNCHLVQRSVDIFLGLPFNVSQYAALTHMIAQVTGLRPGKLVHDMTNVHLYENHYEAAELQLTRKPFDTKLTLSINPDIVDFNDFTPKDIQVNDYKSHGPIKASISV